jgi:hypothetical protein
MSENTLEIWYDDDQLDVIDRVNYFLQEHNLCFVRDEDYDGEDPVEIYHLEEVEYVDETNDSIPTEG